MARSALVVVAHPDPTSLNHALAAAAAQGLRDAGAAVTYCDLHAERFDPVMSVEEARGRRSTDGMVNAQIAALTEADCLVVVHPNCWGAPPAMMKGWMDRVFAPGAAYAFEKGADDGGAAAGLLRARAALVINTGNTTAEREAAVFGDPLDRIWRDCLLGYCGVGRVERLVFRVVATSTPEMRAGWVRSVAEAAGRLAEA